MSNGTTRSTMHRIRPVGHPVIITGVFHNILHDFLFRLPGRLPGTVSVSSIGATKAMIGGALTGIHRMAARAGAARYIKLALC
jgi:hypothetical protein